MCCIGMVLGLASLQKSLQECLTRDAICIYETTANGYGDAKELWDSGACVNLFYHWWDSEEYERDSIPETKADSFITERAAYLRQLGIPQRKINWYMWKYSTYIDKSAIRQEYPCSPEEAFLSTSETIFNKDEISLYLTKGTPPHKKGYFVYERENVPIVSDGKVIHYTKRLTHIRFIECDEGYIRIVEAPKGCSRWTVRLLKERSIQLHFVDDISHMTIQRLLKKRNISLI